MTQQLAPESFSGSPAANYERYFVPAIGAPLAHDLIELAELRPGAPVLDVACGTGVVTRLAAERVGGDALAAVDIDPGMLEVARTVATDSTIEWHEASAEALPWGTAHSTSCCARWVFSSSPTGQPRCGRCHVS